MYKKALYTKYVFAYKRLMNMTNTTNGWYLWTRMWDLVGGYYATDCKRAKRLAKQGRKVTKLPELMPEQYLCG